MGLMRTFTVWFMCFLMFCVFAGLLNYDFENSEIKIVVVLLMLGMIAHFYGIEFMRARRVYKFFDKAHISVQFLAYVVDLMMVCVPFVLINYKIVETFAPLYLNATMGMFVLTVIVLVVIELEEKYKKKKKKRCKK